MRKGITDAKGSAALKALKRFVFHRYTILAVLIFAIAGLFQPMAIGLSPRFAFLAFWYEIDRLICLIGAVVAYVFFGKKDLFVAFFVLLVVVCCTSSLINAGSFAADLYMWLPIISTVLIVNLSSRNHLHELLAAVCFVTSFLCLLNILSMALYPDGLYGTPTMVKKDCFFWWHRNGSYMIALPAIVSSLCLDASKEKRLSVRSVVIFAIALAMIVFKLSVTSLLAMIFFCVCYIAVQFSTVRRYLNGFTYLGFYVFLFFSVVVLRLQNALEPLFNVFGKNATLTMRTSIWDYVLTMLADPSHMILGYGMEFGTIFAAAGHNVGSAHNGVLHLMLIGGWVALIPFITVCIMAAYRLFKERANLGVAYIAAGFGALLLIGLTENPFTKVVFFLFLGLAYYASGKQRKGAN